MAASESPWVSLGEDSQGRQVMIAPYDEDIASDAVTEKLGKQTDTDPQDSTPDPTTEKQEGDTRDGGPIRRFNDVFTDLGSVQLEALGLDGYEVALASRTFRREVFRNEFPLIIPRFVAKCEDCETEFNEDMDACPRCTREYLIEEGIDRDPPEDLENIDESHHQGDLRGVDPAQKREAEQLFESVNKEGQSLRELYKLCEDDHNRLGVGMHVVKWNYAVATGDSAAFDRGEVIYQEVDELVRADPKRVVPVVDENGRIGDFWWACPIHRPSTESEHDCISKEPGRCPHCHTQLKEVFYVEKQDGSRSMKKPEKYYFEEEVIDWAFWYPRMHGRDGLAPTHHVWLKQSVLHWMDIYGAAFYDPSSDRYPNKFMVVHTTNPDTWKRNFKKSEDDAKENPYSQQIMMNEYETESQSTPEVQVIDLMNDDLLGQDDQIKKRYKSDIRQQWNVTDVFDSELEDAGGLNNEGLQLQVTDRGVAARHQDLTEGPLDELAKLIGLTDYRISFVPLQDEGVEDRSAKIDLGQDAADAGLDATWEDGEVEIADGDFEESDTGGGEGLFGEEVDGPESAKSEDEEEEDGGGELYADFSDRELEELQTKLSEGFEHIVWAEEDTKAEPFWSDEDDVPKFVRDAIKRVIQSGVIFDGIESLTPAQEVALDSFFTEKLTQPQGWSLSSMTEDFTDRFGVSEAKADDIVRTETARIMNKGREEAYENQDPGEGVEEGRKFKWVGPGSPDDGRTTDACVWLKEQTDPAFGGEPVSLEKLHDLAAEAVKKFFPGLSYNGDFVVHPNERHTYVEHFKAATDGEALVDQKYAAGPTAPGTFQEVTA